MAHGERVIPFLSVVVCTISVVSTRATPVRGDITLEDIIENVRRNEALYDNVDVTMDYEYELAGGAMPAMPNASVAGRTRIVTHYVSQGGMFRLDAEGDSQTAEGPRTEDRIRAFDGDVTRVYEQNAIGNIITGRADDDMRVQPHILLLRHMPEARVPLSVFLSGEHAVRAHPLNRLPPKLDLVVSYHGTTEFQGLLCHNIAIVMSTKAGKPILRHEFLLAEQRNYLPVRGVSYTFQWSKDLPGWEATVTDLKEIAAGVWYPFAMHGTCFNPFALREKGVQEVMWSDAYTCQSVSLEPTYARSYFSDVKFPDGTAVYYVRDRKIINAYAQGLPAAIHEASRIRWERWLFWTVNALAMLGLSLVVLKRAFVTRRRKRS